MRRVKKNWHLLPQDLEAVHRLAQGPERLDSRGPIADQPRRDRPGCRPPVPRILTRKPPPPGTPSGVPAAADRIAAAIVRSQKICVYGDYDVDGVTGTAILVQLLKLLGGEASSSTCPHRLDEGYGLNAEAVRQLRRAGPTRRHRRLRDHRGRRGGGGPPARAGADRHRPPRITAIDLPPAAAVVHPRLPGSAYPFGELSGAGVAFKLAWAVAQRASGSERVTPELREFLLDAVGLAALGLVADVVPLRDENRILVRHGLARLCGPSAGRDSSADRGGRAQAETPSAPRTSASSSPRGSTPPADSGVPDSWSSCSRPSRRHGPRNWPSTWRGTTSSGRLWSGGSPPQARELVERDRVRPRPGGRGRGAGLARRRDRHRRRSAGRALRPAGPGRRPEPGTTSRLDRVGTVGAGVRAARGAAGVLGGPRSGTAGTRRRPASGSARPGSTRSASGSWPTPPNDFPAGPPTPRLTARRRGAALRADVRPDPRHRRLEPYGAENPRPRFLAAGLEGRGRAEADRNRRATPELPRPAGRDVGPCDRLGMGDRLDELMSAGGRVLPGVHAEGERVERLPVGRGRGESTSPRESSPDLGLTPGRRLVYFFSGGFGSTGFFFSFSTYRFQALTPVFAHFGRRCGVVHELRLARRETGFRHAPHECGKRQFADDECRRSRGRR